MYPPIQVTIRNEEHDKYLTQHILQKAEKLRHYCPNIIRCHIVVEPTQKNRNQGNLHSVHIDLSIPKEEIVINKIVNENIYIAIRDAINAASRCLKNNFHKRAKSKS